MTATATAIVTTSEQFRTRVAAPTTGELADAVTTAGALLAELASADLRWRVVGPLTATLATLVRRTVGRDEPLSSLAIVSPVVHQRDLAVAARALCARDAAIVDDAAAVEARAVASRISMALA